MFKKEAPLKHRSFQFSSLDFDEKRQTKIAIYMYCVLL